MERTSDPDRFKDEQALLQPLNPMPYDIGRIQSQRVKQFLSRSTPITIRYRPSWRVSA
ncbi:MAG: hypothetical protein IPJ27_00140 [Candidatus Accumulibacter sp.]|uniref:Uncharacterized protein n=1 Tax=Candidatus Accumulibacter proximus TaxID=2954385 RepID=A0A935UF50_9PROT|nr:hypothetical protein [Candidatus Accumulibacter proximus]